MPSTLTFTRAKSNFAFAPTRFTYSTSVETPTASALATSLGTLQQEFAPEFGLDVTHAGDGIPPAVDFLRNNGYWIRETEVISAMRDRASGADSTLVALSFMEASAPVVALTSSGIRKVADLKGKRLGILAGGDQSLYLGQAQQLNVYTATLNSAGLRFRDVELSPFEPQQSPSPRTLEEKWQNASAIGREIAEWLQRKEFDAVAVESASDVAHHTSIRIVYDTLEHPDYLARAHPAALRGLVVSGPLLRERRDLVARLLARLLKTAEWAKAHPRQAADKLSKNFALNFDSLAGKFPDLGAGLQLNLGIEKILSLKMQKNFLLRHRLISRDFDIDPWIDHGPLVEAHLRHAGV